MKGQLLVEWSMQKPDLSDMDTMEDLKSVTGFITPILIAVAVIALIAYGFFG
jgi:hypothetical protein